MLGCGDFAPVATKIRSIDSSRTVRVDPLDDLEPSSALLASMVRQFMESSSRPSPSRCGRILCNSCFCSGCDVGINCFAGESSVIAAASRDAAEVVKSLVICNSNTERDILACTRTILEKSNNCKRKECLVEAAVTGLRLLGYDASICRSRWEKTPAIPAGQYDYIDVVIGGERVVVDVDFRSEFEIARPTRSYRAILQSLPSVFVGDEERVEKIVAVVSKAARRSLKKKGLDFPPWRRGEYMRAKWLAPYKRLVVPLMPKRDANRGYGKAEARCSCAAPTVRKPGELVNSPAFTRARVNAMISDLRFVFFFEI